MSTPFRYCTGLLVAWSCFGLHSLAHAQRPAPRNPRELMPRERQFLELDVDLGQSAPFPTDSPKKASSTPQTPSTSEVSQQKTPEVTPVAKTSTPFEFGTVNWRRDFESVERRPIETATFGKGPQRIAVISSLSGNSETTVSLVEKMAGIFAHDELMPVQLSVLVVRSPNPDGHAERTLTNSRGVDLNRNFPSTRFTANPRRETGEKPGSEPETRALVQLLNQYKPSLVVHVVESRSTRGTVRSDDLVPRELLAQFDSAPYDKVYKTGSLAGYVHETMKCSVVELELPVDSTTTQEEDALLQLLVTTLDQSVRSLKSQLADRRNLAQQDAAPASTREAGNVRPDGLRGNVEFLPPPPGVSPDDVKPRFIELPAPPG